MPNVPTKSPAEQTPDDVKLISINYVNDLGQPVETFFRVPLKCHKFLSNMHDRKYYLKSLDVLFVDGTLSTRTDETEAIAFIRGYLTDAEKIYF